MKNRKKIGQYFATGAGTALLASFATFATPKTASAAVLSFNESTNQWETDNAGEAVTEIQNLLIGEKRYNVTFEDFVVGSNTDRVMIDDAEIAFDAISTALGTTYFTKEEKRVKTDTFYVITDIDSPFPLRISLIYDKYFFTTNRDEMGQQRRNDHRLELVAMFEEVSQDSTASTPEPSLIFGLITLGGLMLGSRKSNFIFHQTIPPSKSDISP